MEEGEPFFTNDVDLLRTPTFNDLTSNRKDGKIQGQSLSGLTSDQILAERLAGCEKDLDKNDYNGPVSVRGDPKFVHDGNILQPSAFDENVYRTEKMKSSFELNVEKHAQLNGYQNITSASVTTNYQGFNLIFTPREENSLKDQVNFFKAGMEHKISKNCFEKNSESGIPENDHVNNNPDFILTERHEEFASRQVQDENSLRSQLVKIEPLKTNRLKIVDVSEDMVENPSDLKSSECSTVEAVCPICNITCKSWPGLKSHIRKVHRNSSERPALQQQLVCKCGKRFSHSSRKLYKEHRKNCEIYRKEAFICEQCTAPFGSMQALKNHKYKLHSVIIKARICVCGQSFNTGESFRNHEIYCKVYRRKAMCCGECYLPFLNKGHLKQHLQSTGHFHEDKGGLVLGSSQKLVSCKCGKTFKKYSKSLYKKHQENCTEFMKKAFICKICNSAFDEMPSLNNHKYWKHGILKEPYSCVCGMTFGSGWSLRKHSITCEIYRSAAIFCEECQLPFLTKGHLEQHLRASSHQNAGDRKTKTS